MKDILSPHLRAIQHNLSGQRARATFLPPQTRAIETMNITGKKSRIHQAPMENPRDAVPASVEFFKGRHDHLSISEHMRLPYQPTQPIPIKKCRISPQELEEKATSASHYDWATWCMYDRITTARRLRAVSRGPTKVKDPALMTQDYHIFAQDSAGPVMSHHIHHRQTPSTAAEDVNDGFFPFDDMM
mmetsp:Transcript_11007/g.27078  ORF Transcript_11007/g.27078 Transcript_11007/m.27078 type:complete len:187 (-) Transcript_11007:298-858(-)|eukprot:CAMPEP_0181113330 /NCGR_PEP_ID=MMETSP1071-20121207/20289_1 /TAXON_ID=35127 /ORGANISM="Thalassiosira sp., Strain NH16" /LENGTH=186 /DNA_ID=CAMNT_0023197359 /DNA_START=214 /DNA_END=774 /DNA_ORIENTATION=+